MSERFWEKKSLENFSQQEWEAVCDGCGKCCLHKFIADDHAVDVTPTDYMRPGESLIFTNIVCHLLNTKTCQCSKYQERTKLVPDCVQLTKDNLKDIFYMPASCAYRRLHENRGLPSWHPLLNANKKTAMHKADMSVRGKTINEQDADLDNFEVYEVTWPLDDLD
jgi:uncharacterized cysteine cluster protein YcgN (CxxCxxCC family)